MLRVLEIVYLLSAAQGLALAALDRMFDALTAGKKRTPQGRTIEATSCARLDPEA